jgi:hypothetical protein
MSKVLPRIDSQSVRVLPARWRVDLSFESGHMRFGGLGDE